MQIHIFGDIGGHHDQFMEALTKLGVNTETHTVPPGVGVIQVGDLVHRGPDGDKLVAWVDEALKVNNRQGTGRWVQLFGNHEGHHVGGPKFSQSVKGQTVEWALSAESERTLKGWWGSKKAFMAAAVHRTDTNRDVLVTHAGLTRQTWVGVNCDLASGVDWVAATLNRQSLRSSFAPGWLLGGYYEARAGSVMPPSVAWASAAKEVYPSWEGRECPFDQVHGHSACWNWTNDQSYLEYSMTAKLDKDRNRRFTRWTNTDGTSFYCVDQGLGRHAPRLPIASLDVEGEILIP